MLFPWMLDSQAERMGIYPVNGATVINWRPVDFPPQDDRYIWLRFDDLVLDESVIERAAYNQGKYEIQLEDGEWSEIPHERIRGWAYPIFEPLPKDEPPGAAKG